MVVLLKKYVCGNCGLLCKKQTATRKVSEHSYRTVCLKCNVEVYSSKVVMESMMREYVLSNGRNR